MINSDIELEISKRLLKSFKESIANMEKQCAADKATEKQTKLLTDPLTCFALGLEEEIAEYLDD